MIHPIPASQQHHLLHHLLRLLLLLQGVDDP